MISYCADPTPQGLKRGIIAMLFHVTWTFINTSEEGQKRSLGLFSQWEPPAEANIQGFYGYADGTGGAMIVDVPDATTIARMTATWTPWLLFESKPILPIEESAGISGEAVAYRESNS